MGQELNFTAATAALADAPLGILILDRDGLVHWLNDALESLLGIERGEVLGRGSAAVKAAWRERLFTPGATLRLEEDGKRPARWLQTWTARGAAGTVRYYADITDLHVLREESHRLHEELARHNVRDAVTGLPNRQALLQGLEPLVSRSRRYRNPLSVIRLRIDNLHDIDAAHGRGSGDKVLTAVACMLKDQLRWADLIGRFDNDEFLLVLPETDTDAAGHLLDKLRRCLAVLRPYATDGSIVELAAHLGTASWQPGDDRAKLLRRARDRLEQES
jgi:diguanylate cyclase (GGDEF)-like protein